MTSDRKIIAQYVSRRQFLRGASAAAVSCGALFEQAAGQSPKYVVAETSLGKIRGIDYRGIKTFKGVSYGANTEGMNRFMPPTDRDRWTGVRDALAYGHSAPQRDPDPPPAPPRDAPPGPSIFTALAVPGGSSTGEGEDCLVLNV